MSGKGNERMKILLVEDDMEISEMLKSFLVTENFEVVTAYDGESACDCFFADEYSLVLLDLMIPKRSGMEVMKLIREKSTVPIMILSAKDTDSDKTLGLGLGADDYVTKPFSVTEVLARIKANIRRNTQYTAQTAKEETEASVFRIGQLVLNTEDFTLHDFTTFIDDTLAAELTVLRHSLLFWILCCFRYFSRKWHKIPAGEFVR